MTANTVDDDVDSSAASESKNNDPTSEIASLRERLMRALAETENTRRQGERRAEDAQQYAITNFARELLQVVDNLRRALDAARPDQETGNQNNGLILPAVVAPNAVSSGHFNLVPAGCVFRVSLFRGRNNSRV